MKNIFTQHLDEIGESYFQHLKFALLFGFNMLLGGIACMIHAIFPFLFIKTGSNFLLKAVNIYIERMPKVEKRVDDLSMTIENKKQALQCHSACTE